MGHRDDHLDKCASFAPCGTIRRVSQKRHTCTVSMTNRHLSRAVISGVMITLAIMTNIEGRWRPALVMSPFLISIVSLVAGVTSPH